jgi:hypothetical protein
MGATKVAPELRSGAPRAHRRTRRSRGDLVGLTMAAAVVIACIAWTAIANPTTTSSAGTTATITPASAPAIASNASRLATNASSTTSYPIALLRRHCAHVPDDLEGQFASPATLLFGALITLVLAELSRLRSDLRQRVLEDEVVPRLEALAQRVRAKFDEKAAAVAEGGGGGGGKEGGGKMGALRGHGVSERSMEKIETLLARVAEWGEAEGRASLGLLVSDLGSALDDAATKLDVGGAADGEAEEAMEEMLASAEEEEGEADKAEEEEEEAGEEEEAEEEGEEEEEDAPSTTAALAASGDDPKLVAAVRRLKQELRESKQEARIAAREATEEVDRRERLAYATAYFALCVMVFALQVPPMFDSIDDGSGGGGGGSNLACTVSKVVILPLFKPLTFPMVSRASLCCCCRRRRCRRGRRCCCCCCCCCCRHHHCCATQSLATLH